jgi:hypothetical protein
MGEKTQAQIHICFCTLCQTEPEGAVGQLHGGINRVVAALDEKSWRRFVGLWAAHLGHGGVQYVAEVTGLSRTTILRGRREIEQIDGVGDGRIRRSGGGRKRVEKNGRAC